MRKSEERILEEASRLAYARIDRDLARADRKRVCNMLCHVRDHLFDPDLCANAVLFASGSANKLLPSLFRAITGLAPRDYIEECRLMTGRWLLAYSSLDIWCIAQLLGYECSATFSRAFKRSFDKPPSKFREATRRPAAVADGAPPRPLTRQWLHERSASEIDALESNLLLLRLLKRSPEQRPSFWREPRKLASTTLFHGLRSESRTASRFDSARAIELAELALASLEGLDPEIFSVTARIHLSADGWATLANALRLAGHLDAALQAVETAEGILPRHHSATRVEAELLEIRASICWHRQQPEEALYLLEGLLAILGEIDDPMAPPQILLLKSLVLRRIDESSASVFLDDALELLDAAEPGSAGATTLKNLAKCHLLHASKAATATLLREARKIVDSSDGERDLQPYLFWLAALEPVESLAASSVKGDSSRAPDIS